MIRWMMFLLFAVLLAYYGMPRKQAFSVAAETEYLAVEMVSERAQDWELPLAQVCIRADAPRQTGMTVSGCSERFFEQYDITEAIVRWADGYRLELQGITPGEILISVARSEDAEEVRIDGFALDDERPVSVPVTHGSLLRVPFPTENRPLMPMRGHLRLGNLPGDVQGLVMHGGRYEIRQRLGLNRNPVVVVEGTFFPGDRVGFARERRFISRDLLERIGATHLIRDADMVATIALTELNAGNAAFDVVATTPLDYSALRLTRIGSDPRVIPVAWTARVLSDLLPVALASLLGLVATVTALTNAFLNAAKKPDVPES